LDGVTIQKSYNGRYYIHLDSVASSLKEGSIVTLEGTLTHVITDVTFKKISFIRNADGSFSSYDAEKETVAADSVALDEVWVNLDKFGSYDIASVPLLEDGKAEYLVDSKTPSNTKLTEVGDYEITRVLGNAILADTVGKELGDITYTQTVHLYKTGDANGDGKLSVADIVRQKKEAGVVEKVVKGKTDLNYDSTTNDVDRVLLVDLMLGNKTAEDIYSADASVVIGAISDTHYLAFGSDGQNRINTRKALNYYKSQNAEVIILNGDITDFGEVKAYQKLVEDIVAVYPDENTRPTFIITGDNHEWYGAWTVNGMVPAEGVTFASLQGRFNKELSGVRDGLQDANSYYEVNGYHFIGVSSDGMNGVQCTYDSETIAFVTEKLEVAKNADPNKPIFLAIHQAPPNTVIYSDGSDCFYSAEMDALLKQYPNLVVITSHTHAPLQNEKSISQSNFTTLNTASLYYVGGMSNMGNLATGQLGDIYQFGQGLLIRATGNDVDVERQDFYNNEKIKENWTFTAGDNTKYTTGHTSVKPKFADDAELSVEWVDDTSVNIAFDAATNKDSVEYYEVSAYNVTLGAVDATKKLSSFYWKNSDEIPESFEVKLAGLSNERSYRFEVNAFNCWGESVKLISYYGTPTKENVKVTITGIYSAGTSLKVSSGGSHNGFYLTTDQYMTEGTWVFYGDHKNQIQQMDLEDGKTYGRYSDICWSGENYLYIQTYDAYTHGDIIYIPKGMTFTIGDVTYEIANSYKLTCVSGTSLSGTAE
jgi:predicted phosphodiesterase